MKKIVSILCLGLLSSATFGAWEKIDTEQEYHVFLDRDRIKKDYPQKNNVQAWLKFIVHTDLTPDELSVNDYKIVQYEFNCDEKTRAISAIFAYKNKQLIFSDDIKTPTYKSVAPDSTGEYNLNQVCKSAYPNYK